MIPSKEDLQTEFKTSFGEDVIVSLVAFANAKGGRVYVGVNDKGKAATTSVRPTATTSFRQAKLRICICRQ